MGFGEIEASEKLLSVGRFYILSVSLPQKRWKLRLLTTAKNLLSLGVPCWFLLWIFLAFNRESLTGAVLIPSAGGTHSCVSPAYFFARGETFRHGAHDARRAVFELMFPDAKDDPVFSAENFARGAVPVDVPLDFFGPVFLVGRRHAAMFGAAVPETAVHEDDEALFGEDEIRTSRKVGVTTPAFESRGAEKRKEDQLGGFVAAGTNGRHDAGAFGFGKRVGHGASMAAAFWAGNSRGELKILADA